MKESLLGGLLESWGVGVVPRYVESLLFIKNHPSDTVDGSKIR